MPTAVRVLFISESYPPSEGGVATSTQRIAANLTSLGCKILVAVLDSSRQVCTSDYMEKEYDSFGVLICRFGPFMKRPAGGDDVEQVEFAAVRRRAFDAITQEALGFCADIVLSFFAANAGLLGLYIARHLKIPHVVGIRGNDVGLNMFSLPWLPVLQMIFRGSAAIVSVNRHLRDRLALGFPDEAQRTTVINNGVTIKELSHHAKRVSYLPNNTNWKGSYVIATFIGLPREKKGIASLLKALSTACIQHPIRLLVVGPPLSSHDRAHVGALWDKLVANGYLHCTGHLNRATALQIASEGDLVVMPSLDDGLPNGLLEGMALGLCPVVSDIFEDVVRANEHGWVFPRNDHVELKRALTMAVTKPHLRRRYATAAKRLVSENYSPISEATSYVKIFERVLAAR